MTVRSLSAAASGIDIMQTDLDTIGNDIANSESDGFKSGTAEFEDLLTEQLQPAGAATGVSQASTNPSAIGAGAEVSAIATNFTEGPVTQTGVSSNVAIEGNGFLVVDQNGQTVYTRDGDLQIDANGHLATNSGGLVLGWAPNQPTTGVPAPLSIITGSAEPPSQTANIDLGGNLPSTATTPVTVTATLYDSLGNAVPATLTFTPTGTAGSWTMQGTVPGAATTLWSTPQTVTFSSTGQLATLNGTAVGTGTTTLAIGTPPSNYNWTGAAPQLDFPPVGSQNAVTQFASDQTIAVTDQDGYSAGTLESYSIGPDGTISGTYTNGESQSLGTISLANFANPQGLDDQGNTYFAATAASGNAQMGAPGQAGLGTLQGGAVEGSNVDLATELTDLIEAQTAYQANTKVVDSSSTALQSLVEMS
ncbi:MAG: flagellar hook protein FlgE [Acidimicrobiales bacterium]|jgi:flagellar hook protein FlgE